MRLIAFCAIIILFAYCSGLKKNPDIQELIQKFLKSKHPSWKHTKSQVKSAKFDIMSTYVYQGKGKKYVDCSEILRNEPSTKNEDGVYTIYPDHINKKEVFCDMTTEGGGWTVIQKREDNSTDFYRTWKEYKEGFGNPSHNYWIGNDVIHELTKNKPKKLRIDLERFSGQKGHGEYSSFVVDDENNKYKMTVSGFRGSIGDSMAYENGSKFTTKDQDNDKHSSNCSKIRFGGWWYKGCAYANVNGLYASSALKDGKHNYWFLWTSQTTEALKSTRLMIRH